MTDRDRLIWGIYALLIGAFAIAGACWYLAKISAPRKSEVFLPDPADWIRGGFWLVLVFMFGTIVTGAFVWSWRVLVG